MFFRGVVWATLLTGVASWSPQSRFISRPVFLKASVAEEPTVAASTDSRHVAIQAARKALMAPLIASAPPGSNQVTTVGKTPPPFFFLNL